MPASVFEDAKATLEALSRAKALDGRRQATIDFEHSGNERTNQLHNYAVMSVLSLAYLGCPAGAGKEASIAHRPMENKIGLHLGLPSGENFPASAITEKLKAMQDGLAARLKDAGSVRKRAQNSSVAYEMLTYESRDKRDSDLKLIGALALAHGHADGCVVLTEAVKPTLRISKQLFGILASRECGANAGMPPP